MANKSTAVVYKTKADAGLTRERKQVIVDRELDKIIKLEGTVTPELMIAAAQASAHPLHAYFEWDDGIAGEKYRHVQATQMLLASKVVAVLASDVTGVTKIVHAAREVRRLLPSFKGEGFKMRNLVLDETDARAAFIERKKEALRSWSRSVVDVSELDAIRAAIVALVGE